jgi:hypothetical protein
MIKYKLIVALLVPGSLAAQPEPARDLTPEMLATYTKAHVALGSSRDNFQRALAATHEGQERDRLMLEMVDETASVLSEHEISAEDYGWITAVISVDETQRELFETLLVELSADGVS